MDDAEVKVFVAVTRLRGVIGEFVIELKATREDVEAIFNENLDDILLKLGIELSVKEAVDRKQDAIMKMQSKLIEIGIIDDNFALTVATDLYELVRGG